MTAPVRITARQIAAAIRSAKENGAARVEFDGEKLLVILREDVDGAEKGEAKSPEDEWGDAA